MEKQNQVKIVWEMVQTLMRGEGRAYLPGLSVHLDSKFSKEVLDSIAALRNFTGRELAHSITEVRGKLNICCTMNIFTINDLDRINLELDKIT
jgi:hypothetical protein